MTTLNQIEYDLLPFSNVTRDQKFLSQHFVHRFCNPIQPKSEQERALLILERVASGVVLSGRLSTMPDIWP